MGTGKFNDASIRYTDITPVGKRDLERWYAKGRDIQWDHKNIVKRKGKSKWLRRGLFDPPVDRYHQEFPRLAPRAVVDRIQSAQCCVRPLHQNRWHRGGTLYHHERPMTGSRHIWSLRTALALVAAVGCGGTSPTAATPTTVRLTLDFNEIQVIEDCDGIEGDGDFRFEVDVNTTNDATTDVVYRKNVTLGPGDRTATIGRHNYELDVDPGAPGSFPQVSVFFHATEYDKNILGQTYNDARLDNAGHGIAHSYDIDRKQWVDVGTKSITLGESGCQVRLTWTATPA